MDFDSDMFTSWRVFFTWLDVIKWVFFTMERITTTVVLRGVLGLFMLLSSLVLSFFIRICQTVYLATPNVPAISRHKQAGLSEFLHVWRTSDHFIYTEQNDKRKTFVFAPIFHELNSKI